VESCVPQSIVWVTLRVSPNKEETRLDFRLGYGGSGPAQLALAIVSDFLGVNRLADRLAVGLHQQFKWDVVARLCEDRFEISQEEVRIALSRVIVEDEQIMRDWIEDAIFSSACESIDIDMDSQADDQRLDYDRSLEAAESSMRQEMRHLLVERFGMTQAFAERLTGYSKTERGS